VVAIFRAKIGRANNQAKRNITIMNEEEPSKKKSGSLVIRQMEIDDLAQVFHLGEKLFTAREVPNLYRTWDEYEVINLFQSDSEFCLVAEIDDEIVGFILGTTIEKTQSAWKYGQLVWLGTEPEFQRQGIAVKLFRYFQDLMLEDGVRMLLTDTEADNLPALHFFRKLGFGHPQQHIYLTLNLSDQLKELKGKKER
jgi:ribosomal protein S18 acetylase RimI-like enzyme